MISSRRLRNSGRKLFASSDLTSFFSLSAAGLGAGARARPSSAAGRRNHDFLSPSTTSVSTKSSSASTGWSRIARAPTFDVMMSTAFEKSTVRDLESVSRPSSRICSMMLKTSACAFGEREGE